MKRLKKGERVAEILRRLDLEYPDARCELNFSNPLELLVATILSAQCTDERVNQVTKALFKKYRTAKDYAEADLNELEQQIRPTGFYRNKAKAIKNACRMLVEEHGGKVPASMDELIKLPGVARKTANVILGTAFGIASGIAVDTHVYRLAHRLDLSRQKDPNKVEQDLMRLIPESRWIRFSHQMILHGRYVCTARKPKCAECALYDLCHSKEKTV